MKLPIINQKYVRNADVTSTTELVIGYSKTASPTLQIFFNFILFFCFTANKK